MRLVHHSKIGSRWQRWVKLGKAQIEHMLSALPPIATDARTSSIGGFVPKADYDRTVVCRRKLDAVHPINCPTSQPIKPKNGMGAMSAEITKPMPKPASKILGYGPGQIIVIIGKLIMAKVTPMPCPTPKALETIFSI